MEEKWIQMTDKGFEDTFINSKGQFKRNGKLLKHHRVSKYDDTLIVLSRKHKGEKQYIRVATAVCKYFKGIEVDKNRDKIVYLDGDKTNVCADNLRVENRFSQKGKSKPRKPIILENIISGKTKLFNNVSDAESFLGYSKGSFASMLRQSRLTGTVNERIYRNEWKVVKRLIINNEGVI